MSRLRALLLGLGQIGCGYDLHHPFEMDRPCSGVVTLTHARALACHPQVELVAAVDPQASARQRFNSTYRRPVFADLDGLVSEMGDLRWDLVVVAVPPTLQPGLVELLLRRVRPRLLLLEKPVAIDRTAGERLRQVCDAVPELDVAVNYVRRYLPSVVELQKQLADGDLGRLLHGRLVYGKGLLSNGSHFVNLAEAWLGRLRLSGEIDRGPVLEGFDREASLMLSADEHGDAPLLLHSIGSAGLRAGELDLWFSAGRLRWDNDGKSISLWRPGLAANGDRYQPLVSGPQLFDSCMAHYQHHVLENLIRHMQDPARAPIKCTFNQGLNTLNLLESALNAGH